MMILRRLGRTGIDVSALGLGCYQFTGDFGVAQKTATQILDLARRSEITMLDTAPLYGAGESEELIGRALADHPTWAPAISTKVGHLDHTIVRSRGEIAYRDPDALIRSVKHSLWLLRRDHLEILMIHEPDFPVWGIDQGGGVVLEVLEDLRGQGVIRSIGAGGWNYSSLAALGATGRVDVLLAAGGVNLLSRPMFDELVPIARNKDLGVVVGGTFGQNSRYLTTMNHQGIAELRESDAPEQHALAEKLARVYTLVSETGIPLTELSVRYLLSLEDVHSHIAGAREPWHLEANLTALEKGALPLDVLSTIQDIQGSGNSPSPLELALGAAREENGVNRIATT